MDCHKVLQNQWPSALWDSVISSTLASKVGMGANMKREPEYFFSKSTSLILDSFSFEKIVALPFFRSIDNKMVTRLLFWMSTTGSVGLYILANFFLNCFAWRPIFSLARIKSSKVKWPCLSGSPERMVSLEKLRL